MCRRFLLIGLFEVAVCRLKASVKPALRSWPPPLSGGGIYSPKAATSASFMIRNSRVWSVSASLRGIYRKRRVKLWLLKRLRWIRHPVRDLHPRSEALAAGLLLLGFSLWAFPKACRSLSRTEAAFRAMSYLKTNGTTLHQFYCLLQSGLCFNHVAIFISAISI